MPVARVARKFGGSFILLFAFAFAFSAEAAFPVIKSVIGEPLRLVFSDGREAVLKVSTVTAPQLNIPMTVSETLCSDHQNIRCHFDLSYRENYYFFVWSKNPDPSKINQEIAFTSLPSSDGEFTIELTGGEIPYAPIISKGLHAPKLICDDFSWLPGGQKTAPDSAHVVRWESEFMLQNPETAVSENRSISGANDVMLTKVSDTEMDFTSVASVTNDIGDSGNSALTLIIVGPSLALSIDDHHGDTCQASAQTDSSQAAAQANSFKRPDPSTEKNVYIVGSDEAFSRPHMFPVTTTPRSLEMISEELYK